MIIVPPPACTLTANPTTIEGAGFSTLSWTSTNGASASLTSFGSVPLNGSAIATPAVTTQYTLTVLGTNGQTVTCVVTIIVHNSPNAPSCTLSANPSSIQSGGSIVLNWGSQNAVSASFNQGIGSVALSGSRTESNITTNRTYVLTVTAADGTTATCQAPVVVTTQAAPSCTLTASPSNISSGGSVLLSWTTTNAASATLNQGIGSVALNGSYTFANITSNRTFILTVVGTNGTTINCQTSVVVNEIPNAPSCALNANPNSVNYGGSSTLTWSSSNAVSAVIDNGIGGVAVNGSYVVGNITSNRTYTLTVTAANGQTATCQAPIVVQQINVQPSCTISASQNSIQYGQSITLYWSSTNASSAFINPNIGSVGTAGSMQVFPQGNTTYTLTVTGTNGQTITCQTPVTMTQIYTQVPYCTIYANPTFVIQGQSSVLTWTSQNASSAQLSTVGSVGVNGSMSVTPYNSTTYTLTVWNAQGQQATCTATVQMNSIQYHPPTYYPPTIYPPIQYYPPNIPISYIPYTGTDSPMASIIVLGLIVAASLSGAYLILYSRGGAREMLAQAGLLRA